MVSILMVSHVYTFNNIMPSLILKNSSNDSDVTSIEITIVEVVVIIREAFSTTSC